MRALSLTELLCVWEQVGDRHPIDRALALLGRACPNRSVTELARLPVGRRDAMLLALRERMLGPWLSGAARCPRCATNAMFSLSIPELLATIGGEEALEDPALETAASEQTVVIDGVEIRFHLPDSYDLAAIVPCNDVHTARLELIRQCVLEARENARPVPTSQLSERIQEQLAHHFSEQDVFGEVQLELRCPECQWQWLAVLDVLSFFWSEICVRARTLLHDVHRLARAYAWSEAEILAMSEQRRQYYLNLVT